MNHQYSKYFLPAYRTHLILQFFQLHNQLGKPQGGEPPLEVDYSECEKTDRVTAAIEEVSCWDGFLFRDFSMKHIQKLRRTWLLMIYLYQLSYHLHKSNKQWWTNSQVAIQFIHLKSRMPFKLAWENIGPKPGYFREPATKPVESLKRNENTIFNRQFLLDKGPLESLSQII